VCGALSCRQHQYRPTTGGGGWLGPLVTTELVPTAHGLSNNVLFWLVCCACPLVLAASHLLGAGCRIAATYPTPGAHPPAAATVCRAVQGLPVRGSHCLLPRLLLR
jgi:hypothetical protein